MDVRKLWTLVDGCPNLIQGLYKVIPVIQSHTKSYLVILFDRSYKKSYKVILFGYFF